MKPFSPTSLALSWVVGAGAFVAMFAGYAVAGALLVIPYGLLRKAASAPAGLPPSELLDQIPGWRWVCMFYYSALFAAVMLNLERLYDVGPLVLFAAIIWPLAIAGLVWEVRLLRRMKSNNAFHSDGSRAAREPRR